MDNKKNFDVYVFLSTFARNLIEVFIGTILYKSGFKLHDVMLFFVLQSIFSFILAFLFIQLSKRYSNRVVALISALSFGILQFTLGSINLSLGYIILVSFLYALYRRAYWISRRFYTFKIVGKKDVSKSYSILSIINQVGIMISSYVGALILDFVNIDILILISTFIFLLSVIFLKKMKFEHEKNDYKINIIDTIKSVPKSFIIHLGCYETQAVLKLLMPLYLFIYVKNTYSTIGIVNLIGYFATLIFVYVYAKKINGKRNYLTLSVILVVLINIFKVNTFGILLYIVSFIEGFVTKMYEQSFYKELLVMSKKYEYYNYNMLYEIVQNTFRTVLLIILFFFVKDLKLMIYITLAVILACVFVKLNIKDITVNNNVNWKRK